jgi:DNA-binding NarL/FixJ family response regulator
LYKILLYEDNQLVQENLIELLQTNPTITVAAAFDNASDIVRSYEHYLPDVIVTDIDMPITNGLQGLQLIKQKYPDAKVLILTVFEDNDKVLNAICFGANGYILKSSPAQKIIDSVIDVIQGGSALTPIIASKILQHFPKQNFSTQSEMDSLSVKEKEVLQLLVKGYSYKMIANALDKSIETIKVQIKNIYKKLHVQSNAEAIIKALNSR